MLVQSGCRRCECTRAINRVATVPLQTNHDHEKHGTVGSSVVGDHIAEFPDVLGVEEVIKSGLGDAGEGFVGGGEHGEGTGTGEGVDELAGLEGGDEGGEIGSGSGEVNDGLAGGELGHGVWGGGDVVNDLHNTAGIDVSGGYFGVVDVDVVVSLPSTVLIFSWFLGSLACTEPEATRRSTLA